MNDFRPRTMEELFSDLRRMTPHSRIISGGTDLIVGLRQGRVEVDALLFPGDLPELNVLSREGEMVEIGAACSMSRLAAFFAVDPQLAAIGDAAGDMGSVQIRNRATIGGNIAGASPAGDLIPALWLLSAEAVVAGPDGLRAADLSQLVLGAGRTGLQYNEALVAFRFPRPPRNSISAYHKVGSRGQVTIARLGVAVQIIFGRDGRVEDSRVVLGAVAQTPVRAPAAEAVMAGREFGTGAVRAAGKVLADFILEINKRPNRQYKAWAGPGALADACRKISVRRPG